MRKVLASNSRGSLTFSIWLSISCRCLCLLYSFICWCRSFFRRSRACTGLQGNPFLRTLPNRDIRVVRDLDRGSPAAKAGLVKGDIILIVNGKSVLSNAQFDEQVAQHEIGAKVRHAAPNRAN